MKSSRVTNRPKRNAVGVGRIHRQRQWLYYWRGSLTILLVLIIMAFVSVSDGSLVSPTSSADSAVSTT